MNQRQVRVGCELVSVAEVPTPTVVRVQPRPESPVAVLRSATSIEPDVPVRSYVDQLGNPCQRFVAPAGRSVFRFDATVSVPVAVERVDRRAAEQAPDELPDETLLYTLPSPHCLPADVGDEPWQRFGLLPRGPDRVQAVCDHLHDGWDPATGYAGCQALTHRAIAFCRALTVPARYVLGYLPDPNGVTSDFAAWMEVWLAGGWWPFDPCRGARRGARIVIGRGRDASDVAVSSTFGTSYVESMTVWAHDIARKS